MAHTTKWTKKILMGRVDSENIWLSAPSWDCGWYWGFGYLGNRNCHYHLSGLKAHKNQNLYDAIKEEFGDSLTIPEKDLWTFCELVKTAYVLKETAEVLGRGGSNYGNNPCQDTIKNEEETKRINEIVLPAIFDSIGELLQSIKKEVA